MLACGSSGEPHAAVVLTRRRKNGDTNHSVSKSCAWKWLVPVPFVQEKISTTRTRSQSKPSLPSRIAVIGNYLPRQCGIATFTTDLCSAIAAEYGTARLLALPVNDTEQGYDYPARVRWSLAQDDLASYQEAADS